MLLNWTGKTGKNGFVEFLFSSDGFSFHSNFDKFLLCLSFRFNFFTLKHFLKARLLHILWTRNHLIRVFAFSQWHFASSFADSDGKFWFLFFSLVFFGNTRLLLYSGFVKCLNGFLIFHSYSFRLFFPIMLFDDRKYLKCDLTRWQNGKCRLVLASYWMELWGINTYILGRCAGRYDTFSSTISVKSGLTSDVVHCRRSNTHKKINTKPNT